MGELNHWMPEHFEKLMTMKADPNWGEKTGPFFHLQLPGEGPLGPFPGAILKAAVDEEALPFPEGTLVKDAKSTKSWHELYTHPFFQRRRPQLVNQEDVASEADFIFLLVEGQKIGPYNLHDVRSLIQEKTILLTDQVSFDQGRTWKKLYQYDEFDRRNLEASSLPESPGWDVFKNSNSEIEENFLHEDETRLETEALAGLAFLENLKSGKTPKSFDKSAYGDEPEEEEIIEEPMAETIPFPEKKREIPEPQEATPTKAKYGYAVAIVFLLGFSVYFLTNTGANKKASRRVASEDAQELSPVSESSPSEGQQGVKKDRRGGARSNSYRSPIIRKSIKPRSRRPASITESRSFDNPRRMEDDPYQDNYDEYKDPYDEVVKNDDAYDYDKGETPVEQDQIRAKASKDIIDSENTYLDGQQVDQYDEVYDSQSEFVEDAREIQPTEVWGNEQNVEVQEFTQEDGDLYDDAAY